MTFLYKILFPLLLLAGCAPNRAEVLRGEWTVGSKWQVTIDDGSAKPRQVVMFLVEAGDANSCMGGDWKRLKRIGGGYNGLSEPAYTLSGSHLTILLSSDICDAYDQLDGSIQNGRFSARHQSLEFKAERSWGRPMQSKCSNVLVPPNSLLGRLST